MNIRYWNSTHTDWLRTLQFYKGEVHIYRQRLAEIAARHSGPEITPQVTGYDQQLATHAHVIENLLIEIDDNIKSIKKEVVKRSGPANTFLPLKMETLNEQCITEEKLLLQLKTPFNRFCAEWL